METTQMVSVLERAGARYELLPHARTESAVAEAEALGLPPSEVAKTLVVATPDGYVRAVLPASERLDMHKLRDLLERGKEIRLATEDELGRDYAEFELGAVPPFGGDRRDPVVVDTHLAERDEVVLEGASHEESLRLGTADLLRLTEARVAEICEG
jgi:Ala-tRNA(Pro) deacylase